MIYTVLPAYNEEKNLPNLIVSLCRLYTEYKLRHHIVVINDGSTDQTKEKILKLKTKYSVTVVNHAKNRGLGETIKTGFGYVLKKARPADILITMDADDTHDINAIPQMVEKIKEGYDLVLASRFAPGGGDQGISPLRRVLSHAAGIVFQFLFPIAGVREYTCSYRAYKVSLLKKAMKIYGNNFIREKGFNCILEVLVKLAKLKPRIIEVPFILFYQRKKGKSKMQVRKTLFRYLTIALNKSQFSA